MKKNSFVTILANKNFLRVWLTQLFSLVSATTLNFVLIGKIYSLTHSSVAVAFFIFFYYLPTVLLGFFAGVVVDNWNKRTIFILSNLTQAVMVLSYLGIKQRVWPIYLIVFLYSLMDEFFNPAVGASLPSIVQKNDLPAANSLFFLTSQGSIIAGSFAGGLLLKFLPNQNYIFVFISIFLALATILSLSLPKKPFKGTKKLKLDFSDPLNLSRSLDLPGFWQQVKEGYIFIKNKTLVLFPLLLLAGLASIVGMGLVLFPSLAEILKIEYADTSFFIVLPVILGTIFGGWAVERLTKKLRKHVLIISGLLTMGGSIISLIFLSLVSKPFIFSTLMIFLLGAGYVLIYVPLQTLLQEHTPFEVRGRVFTLLSALVTLASGLPMLLTTTLVDLFGIRLVLFILGSLLIFLAYFANQKKEEILTLNYKNER